MAKLKPGDVVSCRIKETRIVSSYSGFDTIESFQIIALDSKGYYIYVPDHIIIANTFKVDEYTAKSLGIKKQFINCQVIYISPTHVTSVKSTLDGLICVKCNEFYSMAEPNQLDGTLICFICRNYYWW